MRSLGEARAEYEKRYIEDALSRCNNNISRTAIALGVSRVTLQKKMKEYLLR
jgi:transcriptional regulator with PAS, ATPase and Fis domain